MIQDIDFFVFWKASLQFFQRRASERCHNTTWSILCVWQKDKSRAVLEIEKIKKKMEANSGRQKNVINLFLIFEMAKESLLYLFFYRCHRNAIGNKWWWWRIKRTKNLKHLQTNSSLQLLCLLLLMFVTIFRHNECMEETVSKGQSHDVNVYLQC